MAFFTGRPTTQQSAALMDGWARTPLSALSPVMPPAVATVDEAAPSPRLYPIWPGVNAALGQYEPEPIEDPGDMGVSDAEKWLADAGLLYKGAQGRSADVLGQMGSLKRATPSVRGFSTGEKDTAALVAGLAALLGARNAGKALGDMYAVRGQRAAQAASASDKAYGDAMKHLDEVYQRATSAESSALSSLDRARGAVQTTKAKKTEAVAALKKEARVRADKLGDDFRAALDKAAEKEKGRAHDIFMAKKRMEHDTTEGGLNRSARITAAEILAGATKARQTETDADKKAGQAHDDLVKEWDAKTDVLKLRVKEAEHEVSVGDKFIADAWIRYEETDKPGVKAAIMKDIGKVRATTAAWQKEADARNNALAEHLVARPKRLPVPATDPLPERGSPSRSGAPDRGGMRAKMEGVATAQAGAAPKGRVVLSGKGSTFGGKQDDRPGVETSTRKGHTAMAEGLLTGLDSRKGTWIALRPADARAIGVRFGDKVAVRSPKTGKVVVGYYVDTGPAVRTGKRIDLAQQLMSVVGASSGQTLEFWRAD